MDIKNIYEKFSSSVSNPNIVEHFNIDISLEERNPNFNKLIDELKKDDKLSETERMGLEKIKTVENPKEQLRVLFNYLRKTLIHIFTPV